MIRKVKINNFKSVQSLELELGRLNVFIGENGCGKTNILEAIAIGGAAVENKVDNEFLTTRGIRITDYKFMTSAFELDNDEILIGFENEKKEDLQCQIEFDNKGWKVFLSDDGLIALQIFSINLRGPDNQLRSSLI